MWKHGGSRQSTNDNIIRHMRFARWITTHLEYVILIAFPRQQWLRERASLRSTYIACLVLHKVYLLLFSGDLRFEF